MNDYAGGWGRPGDYGLIATDATGKNIGAAWYRDYSDKNAGTPVPDHEITIAVLWENQRRGIGQKLLSELMKQAPENGVDSLGLQVDKDNHRAKRLYAELGFSAIAKSYEVYEVMVAPKPPASGEIDKKSDFLNFLLNHQVIKDADPTNTDLNFDLDETLFRYDRKAMRNGQYLGSWRDDTPEILSALRQLGFKKINVLSSKSMAEIHATMGIYAQQFGPEAASEAFDDLMTTRDYDERHVGWKIEAVPEVARLAAERGRRIIYVDDSPLGFEDNPDFGFINLPRELHYHGGDAKLYTEEIA